METHTLPGRTRERNGSRSALEGRQSFHFLYTLQLLFLRRAKALCKTEYKRSTGDSIKLPIHSSGRRRKELKSPSILIRGRLRNLLSKEIFEGLEQIGNEFVAGVCLGVSAGKSERSRGWQRTGKDSAEERGITRSTSVNIDQSSPGDDWINDSIKISWRDPRPVDLWNRLRAFSAVFLFFAVFNLCLFGNSFFFFPHLAP